MIRPRDISSSEEYLSKSENLMTLPFPYCNIKQEKTPFEKINLCNETYYTFLDGFSAFDTLTRIEKEEEKKEIVDKFLKGLKKSLNKKENQSFIKPLLLSLDYCTKCGSCSEACHIFQASNKNEIYRPIFRSEVFRRLVKRHLTPQGKMLGSLCGADIKLNFEAVIRLGELAYRCNLCRRCTQACPLGLDNSLIALEIRNIFSKDLSLAPKPLHENGTIKQLKTGSSTGINREAFLYIIEFLEQEIYEKTGLKLKIPVDKKNADFLLTHNAGEFISWPENPMAFAILLNKAKMNWTLSSSLLGYDNVNYGIWYDYNQAEQIAKMQFAAADKLGVKKIVIGECGHAHKAAALCADRMSFRNNKIPVESCIPLLYEIVTKCNLKFKTEKNRFPVTLHDPCNIVRQMGIVKPQRKILKLLCPQFREMNPWGVDNYCCGGGSGFAIMNSLNFSSFRNEISSRMKFKQILEAFEGEINDLDTPKYVCAPCSNCKGTIRDFLKFYEADKKHNIRTGGLANLIVNALEDIEANFLEL